MSEAPVVIIGAGPTGMTAAALVARDGVPVTVFEREAEITAAPGWMEALSRAGGRQEG